MSKMLRFISRAVTTILLLIAGLAAHANHLVGMDLFYTWVSGNTYKITLIAYADRGSASTTSAFSAFAQTLQRSMYTTAARTFRQLLFRYNLHQEV